MKKESGTLYGIGVGPGDPDLITLKAVKILNKVDIVFTAASTKNNFSLAVNIAKPHIPEGAIVEILSFPMTKDTQEKKQAWSNHADSIVSEIKKGKHAVFLTLGDPMTYSTFGYVLQNIHDKYPEINIQTIPGITSYQAAAASINRPLVEGEESLLLTSGAYGGDRIRKNYVSLENIVLLKAYKNVEDITLALEESDMLDSSVAISKCSREDEEIIEDVRDLCRRKPDYWTLILAKQSKNGTLKKTKNKI